MSGPPPGYFDPPPRVPEVPDSPAYADIVEELSHLVAEPEPETGLLFHYTSLQALYGILEAKAIWCTEIGYLNDRREQDEFRQLMNEFVAVEATGGPMAPQRPSCKAGGYLIAKGQLLAKLKSFVQRQLEIPKFVFSLTTEHDQLSQWRGYARSDGVAIGFCWRTLRDIAESRRYIFARCGYTEFDVQRVQQQVYGNPAEFPSEKQDVAERMLARIRNLKVNVWQSDANVSAAYLQRLAYLAPIAKDYGFHEEREWRIFAVDGISCLDEFVYHPRRDQLIKRAVLGIATDGPYATPIRQVVLSPALSADDNAVSRIVENLNRHAARVGHHGFAAEQEPPPGKAKVVLSGIPLRE